MLIVGIIVQFSEARSRYMHTKRIISSLDLRSARIKNPILKIEQLCQNWTIMPITRQSSYFNYLTVFCTNIIGISFIHSCFSMLHAKKICFAYQHAAIFMSHVYLTQSTNVLGSINGNELNFFFWFLLVIIKRDKHYF